jgi:hypothetical protein
MALEEKRRWKCNTNVNSLGRSEGQFTGEGECIILLEGSQHSPAGAGWAKLLRK